MKYGKSNCPNAERPGCKENAEKNRCEHMEMLKARQDDYDRRDYRDRRPPRRGPFEGEKKPRFHKMSGKAKKSFVRARLPIKIWKNLIK